MAGDSPRPGGFVVIAIPGRVDSLNLYKSTSSFAQDLADLLFLRLFEEQADFQQHPPSFRPALARSWEFSPDRKTLTLHLRNDVSWSDGTPTTAHDVRYTWQIQVHPEVAWVSRHVKDAITDVEVLDDFTLRVRFDRAYPYQLMDLNEGNVYPKHILEKIPVSQWQYTDFTDLLVFNGPFLLKGIENRDSIELRRNPGYYEPNLPHLDTVFFRTVPDMNSLVLQLFSGEVDVMENLPPHQIRRVEESSRLRLIRFPDRYYAYIGWNTARPPLDRAAVRRALTLAIDRKAIVEGLLLGTARVAASPILSVFWLHDPAVEPHPYDPEEARRLLAGEGWEVGEDGRLGKDGRYLGIELLVNQGNTLREDIAVLVQAQLAKVGIRVGIRTLEWAVFREEREKGKYDGYISAWLASTKVDLKNLLHSAAIGGGGYNYVRYANPAVDSLIDEAREAVDFASSEPLWRRVEEILHEEQPYTLLYEKDRINVVSARVRNVRMDTNGSYVNLKEWWVAGP